MCFFVDVEEFTSYQNEVLDIMEQNKMHRSDWRDAFKMNHWAINNIFDLLLNSEIISEN